MRFKLSSSKEWVIEFYNDSLKDNEPMPYLRTITYLPRQTVRYLYLVSVVDKNRQGI